MSYAFLTFYVPYVLPDLCASGYKVYETGQERWDVCCVTSHSEGGEGVNLEEPKEWTWRNHLGSPAQPWLISLSFRSSVCNSRSRRNERMNKKKLPTICVCGVTVRTLPQVFSPCATSVRGVGSRCHDMPTQCFVPYDMWISLRNADLSECQKCHVCG